MANADLQEKPTAQVAEDYHMRPEDFTDPKDSNGDPLSDSRLVEAMMAAEQDAKEDDEFWGRK